MGFTKSECLINQSFSVKAVMRHFAKVYGEDAEKRGNHCRDEVGGGYDRTGRTEDIEWPRYLRAK